MALRNLRATGQRWLGTPYNGLLAAQILAETATGSGDDGPGALYNEAEQAEYIGKRLRMRMVSRPTIIALRVEENGAYEAVDLPAGANVFAYYFDVDGVQQSGSATLTITAGAAGPVSATAPGATLGATAALAAGSAANGVANNATAPGATLAATSSATTAGATGVNGSGPIDATAPGATLDSSAALQAGSANDGSAVEPGPAVYRVRAIRKIDNSAKTLLPQKDPEEVITVTFDFSGLCGEIGAAAITSSVLAGLNDPVPQDIVAGAKTLIDALAVQRIARGQHDTVYALRCRATATDGSVYVMTAALPVRTASPL